MSRNLRSASAVQIMLPGSGTGQQEMAPQVRAYGMGGGRMAIASRMGDLLADMAGGQVDHAYDEVKVVQPMSGNIWATRRGALIRGFVPGDLSDMTDDNVVLDDGERYDTNLDGLTTLVPGAPDEFHSQVGGSHGTLLLDGSAWPHLNGAQLGPEMEQKHGDMAFCCPIIWMKRKLSATNAFGAGGIKQRRAPKPVLDTEGNPVLDMMGNPVTEASPARESIEDRDIDPGELEPIGGPTGVSGREALIRSPGWVPTLVIFHEQLELFAEGNTLVRLGEKRGPFGQINVTNMQEWLDFNPQALTFGDDCCELIDLPMFVRADLNEMSYHVGIATNTEISETLVEAILIANENARRAHCLALRVASCLIQLMCVIARSFSLIAEHSDFFVGTLNLIDTCKEDLCSTGCDDPDDPDIEVGEGGGYVPPYGPISPPGP